MTQDKDNSKIISSIAGSVTKAGLGLVPGGSVAVGIYELLSLGVEQMAEYMERRAQRRCEEFHERLVAGEKLDDFTAENLDVEDYHALLCACLSEIESEKAGFYGAMASAIALGKVSNREKRFLMLALKELSHAQLQMARKAYIAKRHSLKPHQGGGQREEREFLGLSSTDEIEQLNHESLVAAKIVRENKLAPIGEALVRACFTENELTPSSIGESVWNPVRLNILSFELAGRVQTLAIHLSDAAWHKNMHSSIHRPQAHGVLQPYDRLHVLIIDEDVNSVIKGKEALLREVGKRTLVVVALCEVSEELRVELPTAVWVDAHHLPATELLQRILVAVGH
ncbi:hypothetical protein [Pseudomonas sp. Sample_16]|uniref:hypothetical protein n=1 Tax=Pseudomonas sp. Sample_16 TaxID=2448263 RepID=UPI001032E3DA|nr:hypothetical protein [Pseudomonas sp. Sample_16]